MIFESIVFIQKCHNIDSTVEKLVGLNERLDDVLLELGALKDYMPDDDDLEDLKKYNKPINLPPLKEEKKKHNKHSSNKQSCIHGDKKTK